jgi:hypothetical protein
MVSQRVFGCVIVLSLLYSCEVSRQKDDVIEYHVKLISSGENLVFEVDDSTSFESNYLQTTWFRGEEVLAFESKHKNSIQYYSIKQGEKINEIFLRREGTNAVNEVHGFSILAEDSVLVFDKYVAGALLVDSKGIVLNNYRFKDSRFLNHASMTRLPNVVLGKKLCMFIFPDVDARDPKLFDGKVFFEMVFDLNARTSEFIDFSWPVLYRGKTWSFYHTFPSRILAGQHLVYSFGADENIYVVGMDGSVDRYLAKSDHFDKIEKFKPDKDDEEVFFLENGVYGMMMYDPYREVYYRVAGLPCQGRTNEGKSKSVEWKPYSIIILDKTFSKIGETRLEPVQNFLIKDWFICEKGLCVSANSHLNAKLNEDRLVFNVLTLEVE